MFSNLPEGKNATHLAQWKSLPLAAAFKTEERPPPSWQAKAEKAYDSANSNFTEANLGTTIILYPNLEQLMDIPTTGFEEGI